MPSGLKFLYLGKDEDSEEAKRILAGFLSAINVVITTRPEEETPLLVTEEGRFAGLNSIQTYCAMKTHERVKK